MIMPTGNCQLPTANCQLPTANCQLPTNHGFTLVELSIAIVVVGLLIGGILVGQSLVESAKINKFIRQIASYDVAISTFQSKYKSLPGDSRLFSPSGDNNGWIRQGAGDNYNDSFQGEIASFWKHLGDSKMLKETYANSINETPGIDLPKSALGDGQPGVYAFTAWQTAYGKYTVGEHYFFICNAGGTNYWLCDGDWAGTGTNPVFSTSQAAAIDNKLDDNNAVTGTVRASSSHIYVPSNGASGCLEYAFQGFYNLDSTDPSPCNLTIKIFSTR